MGNTITLRPGYFNEAITDLDGVIEVATYAFRKTTIDFDTLVGTGLSGTLVVPALARALGVNWAIVRKPRESNHDWSAFVGTLGRRWVFVDDFISSGYTLRRVQEVIDKVVGDQARFSCSDPFETEYVGAYLYASYYKDHVRPPGEETHGPLAVDSDTPVRDCDISEWG